MSSQDINTLAVYGPTILRGNGGGGGQINKKTAGISACSLCAPGSYRIDALYGGQNYTFVLSNIAL